jgi:Mg2+-importing ATPase
MTPTATVLRDGTWQEISRRDVVPNDVIRLSAGDLVPTDARLVDARDLHVQQAALTGESMPVEKQPAADGQSDRSVDEREMVFFGTSVVSGSGTAVVLKTGGTTAFGEIATRLAARPPATEFELGTRRFGFLILQTVLFLVLVVFLANIVLNRDPLESLLFSVALAVGLTPEFLPMIIAVTLSRAAVHMARQKVVVNNLAAMQNLGSIDVLCSDKTGTLTSGSMALERYIDPLGHPSDKIALFAYLNSFHETGVKSALDAAILQESEPDITAYQKVDEIPFDFERRRLSIVVTDGAKRMLITKGAPESVLECCPTWEADSALKSLDATARDACLATFQKASGQGLRVLAIAYRLLPAQAAYSATDEKDLVLVGFATFIDPPLADAAAAIQALKQDAVRVKILTWDNELVARYVCS